MSSDTKMGPNQQSAGDREGSEWDKNLVSDGSRDAERGVPENSAQESTLSPAREEEGKDSAPEAGGFAGDSAPSAGDCARSQSEEDPNRLRITSVRFGISKNLGEFLGKYTETRLEAKAMVGDCECPERVYLKLQEWVLS